MFFIFFCGILASIESVYLKPYSTVESNVNTQRVEDDWDRQAAKVAKELWESIDNIDDIDTSSSFDWSKAMHSLEAPLEYTISDSSESINGTVSIASRNASENAIDISSDLCVDFYRNNGECPRGNHCRFVHDQTLAERVQKGGLRRRLSVNFKTSLCGAFEKYGKCRMGNDCQNAHGKDELRPRSVDHERYRKRMCSYFYRHGTCGYGEACTFLHSNNK